VRDTVQKVAVTASRKRARDALADASTTCSLENGGSVLVVCRLGLLDRLVDAGKSVVVIEHHQAVMAHADWIIDLGPGAGHDGGRIVFEGTPADLVVRYGGSRPTSAPDRGQSSVDLDAGDRQRIRGCRHRNAAAAGEIAYRRVNVRCVTPLGDETASMS
jgi:hypothetical protein